MPPSLDHAILHSILICLVARDAHLIIRTQPDDLGLVARLVADTLSSVFGYTTHKRKIRPRPPPPAGPAFTTTTTTPTPLPPPSAAATTPASFLRSLFLPSPASSARTSQDESSDPSRTRKLHVRSRSRTTISRPGSARSISSPADPTTPLPAASKGHHVRASRTHTDPLPPGNKPLPQLPRALVISGLENAGASSQRALAQVLSERSVRFDSRDGRGLDADDLWNLPDGFIVVCVCPLDPAERPQIHKSLLDNFAMSCNVLVKPGTRNAVQSIPLRSTATTQSNPSTPLPSPHMSLAPLCNPTTTTTSTITTTTTPATRPQPQSNSSSHLHLSPLSDPGFPPARIQALHQACINKAHLSPLLSLYLADLFSATRHHPELDGTLLTARCVQDAERLAKAARIVGMDPTGVELLRNIEDEESDSVPEDDDVQTGKGKGKEQEKAGKEARVQLDVTEVDIARIFPRCVSHRLRVRDGPRDEVLNGAVFGATFGEEEGEGESRASVKDILVGILAEV